MEQDEDILHRRLQVNAQGRVVIPAEFRDAIGIRPGSSIIMSLEDGRLIIETPRTVITRLHSYFDDIDPETSLADELIADRREEARHESASRAGVN